jgi:hypothetical protein
MTYPKVQGEFETVSMLAQGMSLARLGDGEMKLIGGGGAAREPKNPAIAAELLEILHRPNAGCIVGIPTMDERGPKFQTWSKHLKRFSQNLSETVTYYSAFVSRPDSAPWIENFEFADSLRKLWAQKRVAVVCERKGSIFRTVARDARKIEHIECPTHHAYGCIGSLHRKALRNDPQIVIISAGPTATCLANRLAASGVQALDLGSAGKFLYRNLWPEEFRKYFPDEE